MTVTQKYSQTLVDASNEVSSWEAVVPAVTALTLPTILTNTAAVETALGPILMGTLIKEVLDVFDNTQPRVLPSDVNAQRERKWLVIYHDNTTGKTFRVTLPTANLTGHMIPGTDLADLANADIAAFVSAFQTAFRSPDDYTHAITIDRIVSVGRNL